MLREALPTWDDVLHAEVSMIERAIHSAGLSRQKSQRIHDVLQWVSGRFGGLTLRPLEELADDDVIELLTTQKGIGVKTAAVVLAFSLDRDICPVDTHVHRISKRLGWVAEKTDAVETFHTLRPQIPVGKAASFHLNLLKFGRNICTSRNPHCEDCPLWDDCTWAGKKPQ
ncbi:endonuclease III [bacterium]|nr:endonuclease III [bacterium]